MSDETRPVQNIDEELSVDELDEVAGGAPAAEEPVIVNESQCTVNSRCN